MTDRGYDIGLIAGDGIGPEIVGATVRVLCEVERAFSFELRMRPIDAGAATFLRTGRSISDEGLEVVVGSDATLKGPVGLPDVRHADGTEAGLLGGELRNRLDLYANLRPIRRLPGVAAPLASADIDYLIVRENTEGLYASRGRGVGNDWVVTDTLLVTRPGTERIVRRAFEEARRRGGAPADGKSRVTCVDKANVLRSMYFFRQIFLEVAAGYPDVEAEFLHADAAAQALVLDPSHFDVLVMENLLGDILSDLGGATVGGIAGCPSGNIGEDCAYFEPIHGSAPGIAGTNTANPRGQMLAAAMMLDYLGETAAAGAVRDVVDGAFSDGSVETLPDGRVVGGADAVAERVVRRLAAGRPMER